MHAYTFYSEREEREEERERECRGETKIKQYCIPLCQRRVNWTFFSRLLRAEFATLILLQRVWIRWVHANGAAVRDRGAAIQKTIIAKVDVSSRVVLRLRADVPQFASLILNSFFLSVRSSSYFAVVSTPVQRARRLLPQTPALGHRRPSTVYNILFLLFLLFSFVFIHCRAVPWLLLQTIYLLWIRFIRFRCAVTDHHKETVRTMIICYLSRVHVCIVDLRGSHRTDVQACDCSLCTIYQCWNRRLTISISVQLKNKKHKNNERNSLFRFCV